MDNFLIFTSFILTVVIVFTAAALITAFVLYRRRKAKCSHELNELDNKNNFKCVKCGHINKRDGTEQIT